MKKRLTAVAVAVASLTLSLAQLSASAADVSIDSSLPATVASSGTKTAPDSPAVTSAKITPDGMTVTWESVSSADGYLLYRYSSSTGHYKYYYVASYLNTFTWDDYADYTDGYRYYITSYVKDGTDRVRSEAVDFTDLIYGQTTSSSPSKAAITKANKTADAVRIYWQKQTCDGYQVYIYKDGSWQYAGSASADSDNLRISGLSANTKYGFSVRAYNKASDGTVSYGEYSDTKWVTTKSSATVVTVTAPDKAVVTKTNKTSNAIRVYWQKQTCDGYQIYIYKNGSWQYAGTVAGTVDSFRIAGLSASTRYGVTVRAYNNKSDGTAVYGEFADNAWVTTKAAVTVTAPAKTAITKTSKTSNAVRVTWSKVSCDGYEVYVYKNNAWTCAGTVSSSTDNLRISGLSQNTTYYFTVRAYKLSGSKKVYGSYSEAVTVKTKAK